MGEVELSSLREIREGRVRLLVPKGYNVKGPGSRRAPFYNLAMTFSRDITVLAIEALGPRVKRFLDGLSSTGVLGLRVALESGGDREIWLNESNPDSYSLLRRNLQLNGVDAQTSQEDLNVLLRREAFDHVDVDPFGSPVPFLDSGFQALRRGGHLSLSTTDVPVLAGAYPQVCLRRYSSRPLRAPFAHEVGLRILVGSVARWAARYDLAVTPILCFWNQHCYRAFLSLEEGALETDSALESLGCVEFDGTGGWEINPRGRVGPLWLGPILDSELLAGMSARSYMSHQVAIALEIWREEASAPPLFHSTEQLARLLRIPPPPLMSVLETLRSAGFGAWRTAFSPTGFKTDASWDDLKRLLRPG